DVPPVGWRGYAVRALETPAPAGDAGPPPAATGTPIKGAVIDGTHYKITIDERSGGLSSVFDKKAQRELVDPVSAYKLNQYVYVAGGEDSRILDETFG